MFLDGELDFSEKKAYFKRKLRAKIERNTFGTLPYWVLIRFGAIRVNPTETALVRCFGK